MALKLAYDRENLLQDMVAALSDVSATVRPCSLCGAVTNTGEDPCRMCRDPARSGEALCVVEDPSDILSIENAGGFNGRYHVLMGRISAMNSKGPWDIRLEKLVQRIDREGFKEVILALGTDMESDSTAAFIHELLRGRKVRITRLASGLPVGSGISYSDPVTLSRAIRGRHDITD